VDVVAVARVVDGADETVVVLDRDAASVPAEFPRPAKANAATIATVTAASAAAADQRARLTRAG
jgi:hypothetical protein